MKCYSIPDTIRGLVFDIDNTLYRNDGYCALQVDLLIHKYAEYSGISHEKALLIVEDEKRSYASGHYGKKTSTGNILSILGIPMEVSAEWRNELFHPEEHIPPDGKLKQTLSLLKDSFTLIAVTNNTVQIGRRTLSTLGVDDVFHRVIGLDTSYKSKPASEPFLAALESGGLRPAETVSVGDRYDVDLETPIQLGWGGILVECIEDVYRLPEVLHGDFYKL